MQQKLAIHFEAFHAMLPEDGGSFTIKMPTFAEIKKVAFVNSNTLVFYAICVKENPRYTKTFEARSTNQPWDNDNTRAYIDTIFHKGDPETYKAVHIFELATHDPSEKLTYKK